MIFCYIFIIGGSFLYKFLVENLLIPSISTLYTLIDDNFTQEEVCEGKLSVRPLKEFTPEGIQKNMVSRRCYRYRKLSAI